MSKAQLCPICRGTGKVNGTGLAKGKQVTCHGCRGKDWITVSTVPNFDRPTLRRQ